MIARQAFRLAVFAMALACTQFSGDVSAGDAMHSGCRHCKRPMARYGQERAGHPECLSILAKHSNTNRYCGGYVGGGAAIGGCVRQADQGTWGWDYSGIAFPKKVWLAWWQGRHAQGGTGAYKTDGPKLLEHEE